MQPTPADARLASVLDALANPTRLALLRALRTPHPVSDIEVSSLDHGARHLSRQAVTFHLDRLVEAGIVLAKGHTKGARDTQAFVTSHQAIFALAEDIRGLARNRPTVEPEGETRAEGRPAPPPVRGHALVVVRGLEEGVAFPLTPPPAGATAEWTLGRRRGLAVALDFDPFVSAQNARVAWDGKRHLIEDLPGSRNGTTVNFRPLARGERVPLRHGDVVGVGRSFLVYWAEG